MKRKPWVVGRGRGWVRIGAVDSAGRRSLWMRRRVNYLELCAGREGSDEYVKIDLRKYNTGQADETLFGLIQLLNAAEFAATS